MPKPQQSGRMTQNNLGTTFESLGDLEGSAERYEEAVAVNEI
jgi:hypothetical protein